MIREKKFNLFKNVALFFCLVPMLVLSVFCLIPQRSNFDVFASDEVFTPYSFVGSNYIVTSNTYTTSGAYDGTFFLSTNARFSVSTSGYSLELYGSYARKDMTSIRYINTTTSVDFNSSVVVDCPIVSVSGYKMQILISTSPSVLTNRINRVRFYYVTDTSSSNWINYVVYYDVDDNYISFGYKTYYGASSNDLVFGAYTYSDRTYYIVPITDDVSGNVYYEEGYNVGYSDGYSSGSSVGYNNGYSAGLDAGYNNGYDAGLEVGNNYTFSSLFGAVIDVPVNAFKSLVNFELLGVNLLGLFTGLLSFGIIILIVKLCMGGR